jgi:hypothetical protein
MPSDTEPVSQSDRHGVAVYSKHHQRRTDADQCFRHAVEFNARQPTGLKLTARKGAIATNAGRLLQLSVVCRELRLFAALRCVRPFDILYVGRCVKLEGKIRSFL